MALISTVIGVGLTMAGIKKIKKEAERKNAVCHFDEEISKESFYVMVKRAGEDMQDVISLSADGPIVYGVARSQNKPIGWNFNISFNDYGNLTGKYWITTENKSSDIPEKIASRIAKQIIDYPDCVDSSFCEQVYNQEIKEGIREAMKTCCPYCEKQIEDEDAKFCMHCGRRFRV